MLNLQIFSYEGSPIEFEIIDGQVFANATAMFRANNARLDHWKDAESTSRYIQAYTQNSGIYENQVVITKQGSPQNGGGTWIHERLILNAARYISVEFELWCDKKVSELLRTGKTQLAPATTTKTTSGGGH